MKKGHRFYTLTMLAIAYRLYCITNLYGQIAMTQVKCHTKLMVINGDLGGGKGNDLHNSTVYILVSKLVVIETTQV